MAGSSPYPDTIELGRDAFAMRSPAKINLRLKVLGKRPDGFHELDTLFQEISLADEIEFHPGRDWRLEIRGAALDAGEDNLVTRAARLLASEAGVACQAHLVLKKRVTTGGGLGGGSSNAAITLLGLSRMWGLNWSPERLSGLTAQLGSDCTFFLYGGLARGHGRGEIIDLLEDRLSGQIVVVTPPFGISTAEVYGWSEFPLTDDEKSVILESCKNINGSSLSAIDMLCNDLENIVLSRYEEVGQMKRELLELGADSALLSGSGSSVFAVFSDRSRALRAAQHFREPYRATICQSVSRPRRRG